MPSPGTTSELRSLPCKCAGYSAYGESRIGGRGENQDSYGFQDTIVGFLLTVCDGMGGGPGGKTASTIAVREIIAGVLDADADETPVNILIKAIRRANLAIMEVASKNPQLKGMGSTCTALLINERCATVAHVDDSRIYQFSNRAKIWRTWDHSMVFEMVAKGVITEEQARLSAQSNVITRALGMKSDVEVDTAELSYSAGDRFLLCSDGIHGLMPEQELVKMATDKRMKLGQIVDNIATTADATGRTCGGGHDNLTIVMLETEINSTLQSPMRKKIKITILALAAFALLSFACNILQLRGNNAGKRDELMSQDSIAALSDSLNSHKEQVANLGEKLEQANQKAQIMEEEVKNLQDSVKRLNSQKQKLSAENDAKDKKIKELEKTKK